MSTCLSLVACGNDAEKVRSYASKEVVNALSNVFESKNVVVNFSGDFASEALFESETANVELKGTLKMASDEESTEFDAAISYKIVDGETTYLESTAEALYRDDTIYYKSGEGEWNMLPLEYIATDNLAWILDAKNVAAELINNNAESIEAFIQNLLALLDDNTDVLTFDSKDGVISATYDIDFASPINSAVNYIKYSGTKTLEKLIDDLFVGLDSKYTVDTFLQAVKNVLITNGTFNSSKKTIDAINEIIALVAPDYTLKTLCDEIEEIISVQDIFALINKVLEKPLPISVKETDTLYSFLENTINTFAGTLGAVSQILFETPAITEAMIDGLIVKVNEYLSITLNELVEKFDLETIVAMISVINIKEGNIKITVSIEQGKCAKIELSGKLDAMFGEEAIDGEVNLALEFETPATLVLADTPQILPEAI